MMVVELRGDLLVVVQDEKPPTDAEWDQEIDLIHAGKVNTILVVTQGGSPNALQRRRYAEAVGKRRVLVSVVTESSVAIAVVSLISWVVGQRELRAFPPKEFKAALKHIGAVEREAELKAAEARLRGSGTHPVLQASG